MKNTNKLVDQERHENTMKILGNIAEEWFKVCGWFLICATFGFISFVEKTDTLIPDIFLVVSYLVGSLYFYVKYFPPILNLGTWVSHKLKFPSFLGAIITSLFAATWLFIFIGFGKLVIFFAKNIGPLIHA